MSDAGLFCKVNRIKDPSNKEAVEQKHTPVIEVPGTIKAGQFFDVTIRVGEIEHPNENGHFIQWVELYAGEVYLGRFDFAPVISKPSVTIPINLAHEGMKTTLRAVSRCNLHGMWEGIQEVKVG